MDSKIDHVVLNGHNYDWAPNMETFLKIKGLWQYIKTLILYPKNDQKKFVINGNKYYVFGVITTYIS